MSAWRERHPSLFPAREPPPGGLSRLKARLREERRPRALWLTPAALASAAAGWILLVGEAGEAQAPPAPPAWVLEHPAAVRLGLVEAPLEEVRVLDGTGRRLSPVQAQDDDGVSLYLFPAGRSLEEATAPR